MEQVLVKGKLILQEVKPNVCKLFFTPENPALLRQVEGHYNYDSKKALTVVLDGIEIVEQEFSDFKIQTWWEKFSSSSLNNSHDHLVERYLRPNKEYSAFIFTSRLMPDNEVICFLYKGKTDVSDGLKMELTPFVIQKSVNSKILYAMDVGHSQLDEYSGSSYH